MDRQDVQTVIQVLPELPFLHHLPEVLVGGRDHPDIHRNHLFAAQAEHLALLQSPQKPQLDVHGNLPDLIQKQGALVGQFEHALFPAASGAGEGPLLVAEELALQDIGRHCRAVDGHKRHAAPVALVVKALGEQLLARARLPGDQDGGVALGVLPADVHDILKCRAGSLHIFKMGTCHKTSGVQLPPNLSLGLRHLLDILEGGQSPDQPSLAENGAAVGENLHVPHVLNLVVLLPLPLDHHVQPRVGQHVLDRAAHHVPAVDLQNLLRAGVELIDSAPLVCDDHAFMNCLQDAGKLVRLFCILTLGESHLNRSVHSRLYAVHGPDVVPPHPLKRRPLQHKSRADHVLDALVVQIRQYLVDLAGLVVNPLRHLHVQQLLHRGNKGHPLAEGDKPGAVSVLSRLFESQEKIEARHLDLYKRRFLHVLFQKTPVSAAAHKHIHRVLLFQPPHLVL